MEKAATARADNSVAGELIADKPDVGKSATAESSAPRPGTEGRARAKKKRKRSWTPEPGELDWLDRGRSWPRCAPNNKDGECI